MRCMKFFVNCTLLANGSFNHLLLVWPTAHFMRFNPFSKCNVISKICCYFLLLNKKKYARCADPSKQKLKRATSSCWWLFKIFKIFKSDFWGVSLNLLCERWHMLCGCIRFEYEIQSNSTKTHHSVQPNGNINWTSPWIFRYNYCFSTSVFNWANQSIALWSRRQNIK